MTISFSDGILEMPGKVSDVREGAPGIPGAGLLALAFRLYRILEAAVFCPFSNFFKITNPKKIFAGVPLEKPKKFLRPVCMRKGETQPSPDTLRNGGGMTTHGGGGLEYYFGSSIWHVHFLCTR